MSIEFDDWSTHLMQASIQMKIMEHNLLHNNYAAVSDHAMAVHKAINKTVAWVAKQGSAKGVDVVEILEGNIASMPDGDPQRSLMIAAIQEIGQLRGERKFWLKSGFDIGKSDAK